MASTTRGARSCHRTAASRSSSPPSRSTNGTWLAISTSTPRSGSPAGPSVRPSRAVTTSTARDSSNGLAVRRTGLSSGAAAPAGGPAEGGGVVFIGIDVLLRRRRHEVGASVGQRAKEVHHPRTPPTGDVLVDLDDAAFLHGGQLVPAGPLGDGLGRDAGVRAVGLEDHVGVGFDDVFRRELGVRPARLWCV